MTSDISVSYLIMGDVGNTNNSEKWELNYEMREYVGRGRLKSTISSLKMVENVGTSSKRRYLCFVPTTYIGSKVNKVGVSGFDSRMIIVMVFPIEIISWYTCPKNVG